jgi:hypothetical protein
MNWGKPWPAVSATSPLLARMAPARAMSGKTWAASRPCRRESLAGSNSTRYRKLPVSSSRARGAAGTGNLTRPSGAATSTVAPSPPGSQASAGTAASLGGGTGSPAGSGGASGASTSCRAANMWPISMRLLCSTSSTMARKRSVACRSTVMVCGEGFSSPARIRPTTFSNWWESSLILSSPRKPAPPLIEWTQRKTWLITSGGVRPWAASAFRSSLSTSARCSRDSSTKVCKISRSRSFMGTLWL